MYESPITIIESTIDSFANAIIKQKDDAIFAEIQHSFGVDLDKDELIRTLQYDRNQYEKGYADGKRDALPKWIPVTERLPEPFTECFVIVKMKYDWDKEYEYNVDMAYAVEEYGYIDGKFNTYNDWNEGQQYIHVTHWMPLPEAPKED